MFLLHKAQPVRGPLPRPDGQGGGGPAPGPPAGGALPPCPVVEERREGEGRGRGERKGRKEGRRVTDVHLKEQRQNNVSMHIVIL